MSPSLTKPFLLKFWLALSQDLNILKFQDIVFLYVAELMHQYYNNTLPLMFTDFFTPVNRVHTYNTRLASKSTYFMPRVETNFGKFNIRFQGAKIWNSIQDDLTKLSRFSFKIKLKSSLVASY